ncbi:MAG TPA: nitronate monooxygenase, partial [Nitrososphaeraceae archaeon]|nr:nitronate monooxygenase [Nitrososphaeraceae archaeon]
SLCKSLNLRYPIIQAGMSGFTTPELVAAVSNSGGLGILGATRMTPEQLGDAIRQVTKLTNNSFGVNLLLAPPEKGGNQNIDEVQQFFDNKFREELKIPLKNANQDISLPPSRLSEQIQIILEEKVPVISFAMGNPPAKLVQQIHSSSDTNAKVMSMITTVEEAVNVVRNGVDIVVAQGAEAGGHRSTFNIVVDDSSNEELPVIGTMTLVPQVVDALKKMEEKEERKQEDKIDNKKNTPVIAAGGISDGRGLVAALALGADGIMIGTRFLVARESGAFQAYQDRLLAAKESDTVITRAFTGRPARGLRNRFIEEYNKSGPQPLAWPLQALAADDIYATAQKQNNADYFPLLAGQGVGLLKGKKQSAEKIIQELVLEANKTLSKLK